MIIANVLWGLIKPYALYFALAGAILFLLWAMWTKAKSVGRAEEMVRSLEKALSNAKVRNQIEVNGAALSDDAVRSELRKQRERFK